MKKLISLMNGTIIVKSQVGKGTNFRIMLPLEVDSSYREDSGPDPVSESEFTPENAKTPEILIVDDSAENRFLIRQMLKKIQCKISEAADGQEALNKSRLQEYDLILIWTLDK